MTRRFLSFALLIVAGSSAGLYMTTGAIAFAGKDAERMDAKPGVASRPTTLVAVRPPVPVVVSAREKHVVEGQSQVQAPRTAAVREMSPAVIRAGAVQEQDAVPPSAPAVLRGSAVSEPTAAQAEATKVRVASKAPDNRAQGRGVRGDGISHFFQPSMNAP